MVKNVHWLLWWNLCEIDGALSTFGRCGPLADQRMDF
jgi:hypothetical protein